MIQNFSTNDHTLQQIADMLMLNGLITDRTGLVHGKTGIAIFFFHYARYTGNELFEDYAMDLFGEIRSQIHKNSQVDYEEGIAGIGIGIDYLVQNKFLMPEGDIFKDFDDRMYRAVMFDTWQDFSLYEGLTGYGKYWLMRLRHQTSSMLARDCLLHINSQIEEKLEHISEQVLTDVHCFLHDIAQIHEFKDHLVKLINPRLDFFRLGNSTVGNIARMYQNCYYFNSNMDNVDNALKQALDLVMEKQPSGTGLLNGYAGEGMLCLTALNKNNISWMHLL